jgi:hypothetical protein
MITNEELSRLRNTLGAIVHASASVGDTATDILPDEPEKIRHKMILTNTDEANAITVSLGETARTGKGLVLLPGQAVSLDNGSAFSGRVSAVCAAGLTATVAIFTATRTP